MFYTTSQWGGFFIPKMIRIENLSKGDFRPELVRAIARPGRGKGPSDVIHSLTEQGADPCELRRETLAFVNETGGPSSIFNRRARDAFAEHDIKNLAAAVAEMSAPRENK